MSRDNAKSFLGIVMHVFSIVVSVVCLTGAAYFYRQSQESLKDYVTEKSFSQYKLEHDKWAAEVLTQLRGDIADLKTTQRDMNAKLDTLLLRPQRAEFHLDPTVPAFQHNPLRDFSTIVPGIVMTNFIPVQQ